METGRRTCWHNFYLFFIPDSIILYDISTGRIYAAWDLTQPGSDLAEPSEPSAIRRRAESARTTGLVTRPRILFKPEPAYTSEARENQITGTVVLAAVFAETGEVTDIQIIKGLSHGLNDCCLEAAKQIKFVPAESNGKKISFRMRLEYNFNLY